MSHDGGGFSGGHHGGFSGGHHHGGFGGHHQQGHHHSHHQHGVDVNGNPIVPIPRAGGGRRSERLGVVIVVALLALGVLALLIANSG